MSEAIRDARRGETLDFKFAGNGRETAREVAFQNEKLQEAIATYLPTNAMPDYVKLGEREPVSEPDTLIPGVREAASKALESVERAVEGAAHDVAHWTPDMPLMQFEQLISRIRGGSASTPAISDSTRVRNRARGPEVGR